MFHAEHILDVSYIYSQQIIFVATRGREEDTLCTGSFPFMLEIVGELC